MDFLYGGENDDLAAGDCVFVAFDENNLIASITSISEDTGKADELRMGNGNDIAIGGMGGDVIFGDDGMDILVGDSAAIAFHSSELNMPDRLWSAPMAISSISCQHGGEDFLYGGTGTVNYM